MTDLGCWGGKIIETDETGYSPHSAILKCSCGIRGWHTKNIGYIGARTIYNFAGGCDEMQGLMTCAWNECTCSMKELSVDEELIEHAKNCKECKEYGL